MPNRASGKWARCERVREHGWSGACGLEPNGSSSTAVTAPGLLRRGRCVRARRQSHVAEKIRNVLNRINTYHNMASYYRSIMPAQLQRSVFDRDAPINIQGGLNGRLPFLEAQPTWYQNGQPEREAFLA